MEYEAAAFATRTYSAWKNTHTSAVEAGVMRRELLRNAMAKQANNGQAHDRHCVGRQNE